MKKSILNIGKALNKAEQKLINGGTGINYAQCLNHSDCPSGYRCVDKYNNPDLAGAPQYSPGYCIVLEVD
ncbi:hypothetical protein F7018_04340 [Tenacibaculum aiptasiae]|uniref:Bacteriocin n=1 Tax=Tenacibaculum aiptasiae TaxID=426481 RepID=A0A7J5APJ4_9FLAO|nr:hypothetical protein [Tenacibaculum aiptasiae]KAB1159546.1 hypothetical protein F7018_04340 [Tenacibaculum aiptasiae]